MHLIVFLDKWLYDGPISKLFFGFYESIFNFCRKMEARYIFWDNFYWCYLDYFWCCLGFWFSLKETKNDLMIMFDPTIKFFFFFFCGSNSKKFKFLYIYTKVSFSVGSIDATGYTNHICSLLCLKWWPIVARLMGCLHSSLKLCT